LEGFHNRVALRTYLIITYSFPGKEEIHHKVHEEAQRKKKERLRKKNKSVFGLPHFSPG
jgi:hypothetical protein